MRERKNISACSDAELITLAKAQLPYATTAYEVLMLRHQHRLHATCMRLSGHLQDAEDMTQEVMLKVFHGLKGFDGNASFTTWMYSIAMNVSRDHWRKQTRSVASSEEAIEDSAYLAHHDKHEVRLTAHQLLAYLTESERMVVTLRHVAGLDFQEIADAMGIGLSAAKMRHQRTMAKLTKIIKNIDPET